MKKEIKGFIVGCIISTVGLTSVLAAGGIKSAQFNSNKVIFNGKILDLSTQPMISVVKDGEQNASNYMPVRAVLEQMGYNVEWYSNTNTVVINTKSESSQTTPIHSPTPTPTTTPKIGAPDTFYFSTNSADGVAVTWSAKNNTGKAIKYYTLNFLMYNRVGDPALCTIKKTNKSSVTYVGPVEINGTMLAYQNILGYTAVCSKIVLNTIDLEYMDDTKETINYSYSTTKQK